MIKVSIIIPIYNMAEWIEECIVSIEQQSLKEIEIICIDDGSTDGSLDKLNDLAKQYDNIVVLTQDNQGSGPARNLCIKHARGEYLGFCDADDYYASNEAIEHMYDVARQYGAMLVHGNAYELRDGVKSIKRVAPERRMEQNTFVTSEEFPGITGFWAGIFNREFLIDNHIEFPPHKRGQDSVFFVEAIAKAGKIYCMNEYVYVHRSGHKEFTYDEEKAVDNIRAYIDMLNLSSEYRMKKVHQTCVDQFKYSTAAYAYHYAFQGNKIVPELFSQLTQAINPVLLDEDIQNNSDFMGMQRLEEYKRDVYREQERFLNMLNAADNVFIYGAGMIGKQVNQYLKKKDIHIRAFLVSDKSENPEKMDGIEVQEPSIIDAGISNYLIVVATLWRSHESITKLLESKSVKNIYFLNYMHFLLWQDKIVQ